MAKTARALGEPTSTWQLHLSRFPQALRYRVERYILEWNHAHPAAPITKRDLVVEALEQWLAAHEAPPAP